jgi:PAS domain S-box-containing protein
MIDRKEDDIQWLKNISSKGIGNNKDLNDIIFYRFIINSLPIAILTVDSELKITSFNPWAEVVTGFSAADVLGSFCGEILHGAMCDSNCPLKTTIRREYPFVRVETSIRKRNGTIIPARMNTAALLDDNGQLIGAVEAFQDISFLKAMEREKDNLISMFAHDMKSSLSIIGGFVLRLMKTGVNLNDKKNQKYLSIIRNETDKLDFLINDFLEFSRLQNGKLKLDFQPMSLDKELMELIEAYQPNALRSEIDLEIQNDEVLPVIQADVHRLRRAFTNLLDNAFKYSSAGDTIALSTGQTAQEVIVTIADQGRGIDPEDLPHIFDMFHRGKATKGKDGSGVGLAVVKAIVEGHGGTVLVESQAEKGSTFTVVLPKAAKGLME